MSKNSCGNQYTKESPEKNLNFVTIFLPEWYWRERERERERDGKREGKKYHCVKHCLVLPSKFWY